MQKKKRKGCIKGVPIYFVALGVYLDRNQTRIVCYLFNWLANKLRIVICILAVNECENLLN